MHDTSKKKNFALRCFSCETEHDIDAYGREFYDCTKCGGLLEVKQTKLAPLPAKNDPRRGVWRYSPSIPIWNESNIISLQEGGTSLIECRNLSKKFGISSLYVKVEGQNPTGSFKDRGMTVGISKAVELGYKGVICASTGNTSASLAAYSARAGLRCLVLIPKGKVALGKVAQAVAYGAEIQQVEGNFDDALKIAMKLAERDRSFLLLNSINPFRLEGQKTVAFEIFEQLGRVPTHVILPVGNGGNISAAWKGFSELPLKKRRPKMVGVQAEGAAPIARAWRAGRKDSIDFSQNPHTDASAINIGSPVNWPKALAAIYESGGLAEAVSEEEIFKAQRLLSSSEGVFVEPASAAPIAYLAKQKRGTYADSRVVCIATGNGLKDPNAALRGIKHEVLVEN